MALAEVGQKESEHHSIHLAAGLLVGLAGFKEGFTVEPPRNDAGAHFQ